VEGRIDWRPGGAWAAYAALALTRREHVYAHFRTRDTGTPLLAGSVGITREGAFGGAGVWMDAYLRGERGTDTVEADGSARHDGGWVTGNLELGLELGGAPRYRLALGLLNLGDRRYRTATENLYAPGRAVEARLSVDF
jgi:outer membrane receptor protein involved in Fe transport